MSEESESQVVPGSASTRRTPEQISSEALTPVDAAQAALNRATLREIAAHAAYGWARNVLRARERRRALAPLALELFSTPGRRDAHLGRSVSQWAWGLPVWRGGHVAAVVSPTASAITPPVVRQLGRAIIVVASPEEQERIERVTGPRQRFALLSVRIVEPTHGEIIDYARRHGDRAPA